MGFFRKFIVAFVLLSVPMSAQAPSRKPPSASQVEADGTTPLHRAVLSDDLSSVQRLLRVGRESPAPRIGTASRRYRWRLEMGMPQWPNSC